jgi:hypothetical protein
MLDWQQTVDAVRAGAGTGAVRSGSAGENAGVAVCMNFHIGLNVTPFPFRETVLPRPGQFSRPEFKKRQSRLPGNAAASAQTASAFLLPSLTEMETLELKAGGIFLPQPGDPLLYRQDRLQRLC